MIVADSSYIVEGLLRNVSILESETIVAPDLALYEVVNTLWKHECKLRDIPHAGPYLESFIELLASRTIQLLHPDGSLIKKAYNLASEEGIPFYDAIFIALAIDIRLELKTYDETQRRIIVQRKRRS
jgi:predicted nucleic acid-binding protein